MPDSILGGRPYSPFREKVLELAASGENLSYKQMALKLATTKGVIAGILDRAQRKANPDRRFGHPDVHKIRVARDKAVTHKGKNTISVPRLNKARKAGAIVWGTGLKVMTPDDAPLICDLPDEQIVGVAMVDLQLQYCRWPLGGGFSCGADKAVGAYCVMHARRAFRPARVA